MNKHKWATVFDCLCVGMLIVQQDLLRYSQRPVQEKYDKKKSSVDVICLLDVIPHTHTWRAMTPIDRLIDQHVSKNAMWLKRARSLPLQTEDTGFFIWRLTHRRVQLNCMVSTKVRDLQDVTNSILSDNTDHDSYWKRFWFFIRVELNF